jgi:hypothetical protein
MNVKAFETPPALSPWCAQAGEDLLREVSRAVAERDATSNTTSNTGLLLGLLVGLGLVLAAAGLWRALRTAPRALQPSSVFEDLARRLGLQAADRALLRRVSHAAGMPSPLVLLLVESVFDAQVGQFLEQSPRWRRGSWARRLGSVRARAFVLEDAPGAVVQAGGQ